LEQCSLTVKKFIKQPNIGREDLTHFSEGKTLLWEECLKTLCLNTLPNIYVSRLCF
jgi:hypothetical protein